MWLKERFGDNGINRMASRLSPDARKVFDDPKPNIWYPSAITKEFYTVVKKEFGKEHPDVLLDFARFNVEKDISGPLRFLMRLITIENLIKRAGAFWKHYNRGSTFEISPAQTGETRKAISFRILNYNLGEEGCTVVGEYMRVLASKTDGKNIKIEKKTCISKGDDFCSWEASWDR